MYFPILRGRQFELLALRECVEKNLIGDNIIPIVEPVKVSTTYTKTVETFINANRQIAIIRNPQVGDWVKGLEEEGSEEIRARVYAQLQSENVISAFYLTPNISEGIKKANESGKEIESLLLISGNPENLAFYEEAFRNQSPRYNIMPDKGEFRRRIRSHRILCEDHFSKKTRNKDYSEIESEFFSSDHLYYSEDGYEGFADYSVIGKEYNNSGFAPYAVAIHIVYFDDNKILRIAHFVSDSNDDISDPARKFEEAVEKLVRWNAERKLETFGIKQLENAYKLETYPGLGVVKKLSIMHHLELMNRYLEEVSENDFL